MFLRFSGRGAATSGRAHTARWHAGLVRFVSQVTSSTSLHHSSGQHLPFAKPYSLALLDDDRIRVPKDYNRWRQLAPIISAGLAIGFYALPAAALGPSLCKMQGVVAQSATDFSMSALVPTTTLMPLTAGVLASLLASRCEHLGVRRLAFLASVAYPVGVFVIPGIAAHYNSFATFAVSYVALGGFGFFCAYPQQAPHALRWFPDRKGLAVSLFNVSFGFGLLLGVPLVQKLVGYFKRSPTRLGSFNDVMMTESGETGSRMAIVNGSPVEVVLATQRDLDLSGFPHLAEGVFLLDGSNGSAETMVCLGALGSAILQLAAWTYRLPAKGFVPGTPEATEPAKHNIPVQESVSESSKGTTPQGAMTVAVGGHQGVTLEQAPVRDAFRCAA